MDKTTQTTMFSSASTEYMTPPEIFEPVAKRLGLNFDVAASFENHQLPNFATPEGTYVQHFTTPHKEAPTTGLDDWAWRGRRVWCNPPYGRGIDEWVKAAAMNGPKVAALLLPARTETEWFQRWVAPYAEVHFLMGRIRFWGHLTECYFKQDVIGYDEEDGSPIGGLPYRIEPDHSAHQLPSAPFPSIIAVYDEKVWVPQGRVMGYTWDPRSDPEWSAY